MAHMIDTTTGAAAMAYVGQKPWHGLGVELPTGAGIEQWAEAARLNWEAKRAPVEYTNGERHVFDGQHVIYRSDTGAPLSIVSGRYQIVQPAEVLDFFARLSDVAGFEMETAGALFDGKRIWALAKVADGADAIAGDKVVPYCLLATSYDKSIPTTARFTSVRVVCNNTLTAAYWGGKSIVAVPHSTKFDADAVRQDLGIFRDSWERFQHAMKATAATPVADEAAELMTIRLVNAAGIAATKEAARESKAFAEIMARFNGAAIGSELAGKTAWQFVNAVTEYVDHARGRTADTRIASAFFGPGHSMKEYAAKIAAKVAGIEGADEAIEAEEIEA